MRIFFSDFRFSECLCAQHIFLAKHVRGNKQVFFARNPKGIKQKSVYRSKNNARDFYVLYVEKKICSVGVRYPFINRV